MRRKISVVVMIALLGISFVWIGRQVTDVLSQRRTGVSTVVIDAGHGGSDPGKVGINGVLEKDINLAIAGYLKEYLVQNGVSVVMTRETDKHLSSEETGFRKVEDLKCRLALIDSSDAVLAVSIHQNSYASESVHGPQVFYYKGSEKGKEAAEILRDQLGKGLMLERARSVKGNDSYYLLKKSVTPTVIVECGFLSNWAEAELLKDEDYQKKMAWQIAIGVMRVINAEKDRAPSI